MSFDKLPRKSFTSQYKLSVSKYFDSCKSARLTCDRFSINPSMLCRWNQQRELLTTTKKSNARRLGRPGRKISYPEHEQELFNQIIHDRQSGYLVSCNQVRDKMLELTENTHFKASTG